MKDAQLEKLISEFEKMTLAAPEEIPLTQQEMARKVEDQRRRQRDMVIRGALGRLTGWPAKYAEEVKTPPHGEPWLAAYGVAAETVARRGILVLYGKRGGGKTRMAAELAMMVGSSRYRTAMRFLLEIRETFRKDSTKAEIDILNELTGSDLLILDEIQERGETAFEDRLLTHVIDTRYATMKPTIMIANLTKGELADSLGPSIVDRARENGKSIEFTWPSYRGRN
jgi:DNA replication protein DnaC